MIQKILSVSTAVGLTIGCFLMALAFNTDALPLKTEKWQTQNGAQVIFYQTNDVPMLDIYVAFAAGSAYDNQFFGLSTLTTRLLNQGNGQLDATQVAESLDKTGAQFKAENNQNMALFHLRTLTNEKALQPAVDTFALILNQPRFRQDAFYREKNQLLSLITKNEESPDDIASIAFFNQLYGEHPYAHPINGTQDTVKNLQSWQVRRFYKKYFVGENAVIVMVGDINQDQAKHIADMIIGRLDKGEAAAAINEAQPLPHPEKTSLSFPSTQTMIRLGQLGINYQNPNYFPLLIGNYILGGGALVSELTIAVREKQGLSYNIQSQLIPMPAKGPFIISLSTKNNQTEKALAIIKKTITHFLKNGPTEKEVADAKQFLIGNFSLSLSSNDSIAAILLRIAFYHLPDNYLDTYVAQLENVNIDDIKTAFDLFLKPEQLVQVTVGKM